MLAAIASGALLDGAFPGVAWWPLAPIALALYFAAIIGRGFWAGAALSALAGASFWLLHISWLTLYLGPLPWAGLAGLMTIYVAIAGGLIALAFRYVPVAWPSVLGRLVLTPVVVAGLWLGRELFAASWPYGGFSWGRVGMSQTDGVLSGLFSWVGGDGVSFVVAALAAAAVQLLREPITASHLRQSVGVFAGTVAVLALVPAWQLPQTGTLRILAVQGAVDASLFSDWAPGDILIGQTQATLPYLGERVDAVVWPENSSDLDPTRNDYAARVLTSLSRDFAAPIFVGTITERDNEVFNSSFKWQFPDGLTQVYDKIAVVPFAEYMPDRALWRPFAPDLVDLISRDYSIGTLPPLMSIGTTVAGVAICFDIAEDAVLQQITSGGAQLILAQTNNADFGRTDESRQQLAIARMRALETGLAVVNISTVGSSAVFDGHGNSLAALPEWEPGGMLVDVPVATSQTPASRIGPRLGLGLSVFALMTLGAALALAASGRNGRSDPSVAEQFVGDAFAAPRA